MISLEALKEVILNKPEAEARANAKDLGFGFRVVSRDGVPHLLTHDIRNNRINVNVNKGKVSEVMNFG